MLRFEATTYRFGKFFTCSITKNIFWTLGPGFFQKMIDFSIISDRKCEKKFIVESLVITRVRSRDLLLWNLSAHPTALYEL